MADKRSIRWDVKRGSAIIRSIPTPILKKSLGESYRPDLICRSGTNDWRRPKEFEEFNKEIFEKKTRLKHKLQKEGRKDTAG